MAELADRANTRWCLLFLEIWLVSGAGAAHPWTFGTRMKPIGLFSTTIVLLVGAIALGFKADNLLNGFLLIPISLGPLFVSLLFAHALRAKRSSQVVLTIGSAAYAVWFSVAYLNIFYWHSAPRSAIGLLFIGVYALPVMVIIWVVAAVIGRTLPEDIQ